LSLASLAVIGCFPLPGLILGIIGWWMGQADLAKMKAGSMDPEGKSSTQGGWICSIIGTIASLLMMLLCGGWFGFMMYMDVQASNRANRPGFAAPPPVIQPPPPVQPMQPKQPMPPPPAPGEKQG
jgi:hypothetical protein